MSHHRIFYPVISKVTCLLHRCLYSHSLQMGFHCSFTCMKRIQLTIRIIRCRFLMCSPMVQHLVYVGNFICGFYTAKNKIIILSSIKLFSEAPYFTDQYASYHKQMADIIIRPQQIQIKIRFHIRRQMLVPFAVYFVLICIHRINPVILQYFFSYFK